MEPIPNNSNVVLMYLSLVTSQEAEATIRELKRNAAPGDDNIIAKYLVGISERNAAPGEDNIIAKYLVGISDIVKELIMAIIYF